MTVILKSHKLFYASVPKVACSSIKRAFYEIEYGKPFEGAFNSKDKRSIHQIYPGELRQYYPDAEIADFRRLTLVRDPIARFLSAYSNRVAHRRQLSEDVVKKADWLRRLKPHPDLHEFVDRFEKYLAVPDVHNHCRPMVDRLGSDAGYFHAIYDISQMDAFLEDVSNVVGRKVEAGRFQTGGPKLKRDDLTAKQVAKLERFYKDDYAAFGSYF